MAFKVFNNWEAEAEAVCQARLQQKVALPPAANTITGVKPKSGWKNTPLGACFKFGKEGHWACQCPQPRPLTKPCPECQQLGHWRDTCPLRGSPRGLHAGLADQGADFSPAQPELLGLLDD